MFVCLTGCHVFMSDFMSFYLSVHLSVCLYLWFYFYLYLHLSVSMSIFTFHVGLYICLSVCLSVSLYIYRINLIFKLIIFCKFCMSVNISAWKIIEFFRIFCPYKKMSVKQRIKAQIYENTRVTAAQWKDKEFASLLHENGTSR